MNLPHKVRSHYEAVGGIPELDGRYTVFGQVIEGMSVVREIASQETDDNDAQNQRGQFSCHYWFCLLIQNLSVKNCQTTLFDLSYSLKRNSLNLDRI
jgi:hypothetical protein